MFFMQSYTQILKEEFAFLEAAFGYKLTDVSDSSARGAVFYMNCDVGVAVKVEYDASCAFIFVFICRLIDGVIRENRFPIGRDSEINCFDFNDYLEDNVKMRPAYNYDENSEYYHPKYGLRNFARAFATRLRTHGPHILRGDLSMLPSMVLLIEQRRKALNEM